MNNKPKEPTTAEIQSANDNSTWAELGIFPRKAVAILLRRLAEKDKLIAQMMDSINGCNENNREFAKTHRSDQILIEQAQARLDAVKNVSDMNFILLLDLRG